MSKELLIIKKPISETPDALLKLQKIFNKHIKKIKELEQDISNLKALKIYIFNKVETELKPIEDKVAENEYILVNELCKQLDKIPKLNKKQLDKVRKIILEIACPLVFDYKKTDLIPLIEKHTHINNFEQYKNDRNKMAQRQIKDMLDEAGITLEEDIDIDRIDDLEYIYKKIAAQLAQKNAENEEKELQKEENKTEKQKNKAIKQKEKERAINMPIKEIYKNLVKHFHPDKEPDEQKRIDKTNKMQQINEAYQSQNLLRLLELQYELHSKNAAESFDETEIKNINKLLKNQTDTLETEYYDALDSPDFQYNMFLANGTQFFSDMLIKSAIKETKDVANLIKSTTKNLKDEAYLRSFINDYELD
jgi:hypothetical protein